jgi:hypothetical protein
VLANLVAILPRSGERSYPRGKFSSTSVPSVIFVLSVTSRPFSPVVTILLAAPP